MAQGEKIRFIITRRDGPDAPARWEEFDVDWEPTLNVIGALMKIQRNPVTANGAKTTPVAWESNCLEEVCGACTMVINGQVRQACTALIDKLEKPIRLEPMSKFPLVRDLAVNRQRIFEDFKRVKAWIPIDGSHDLGPGPRCSQDVATDRYAMARCMSCGCCMEVCPQYGEEQSWMGAAPMNQIALMNSHPTGALNAAERLDAAMGPGGIVECGNAQACVYACPKEIPLTDSLSSIFRETAVHGVKQFFKIGLGGHHVAGPG